MNTKINMPVSESIFSGERVIIPMADVQHIEKHWIGATRDKHDFDGIVIITKHTKWSIETDTWENNIYLSKKEAIEFLNTWCLYRNECECIDKKGGE